MGHFFVMYFAFVQFIPRCQCTCMFIQNAYIYKITTYKHINSDHSMMPNYKTKKHIPQERARCLHKKWTSCWRYFPRYNWKRQFWVCTSQSVSWNTILRTTGSTTLVRSCFTLIVSSQCVCIQEYTLMAIISEMKTYTSFVL